MENVQLAYIEERVKVLSTADTSKQETKDAAKKWLDSVESNVASAESATNELADFLEGRLLPIDDLIAFVEGPGAEIFGAEAAQKMLEVQRQRKENGEKYCNCEAHAAAVDILAKLGRVDL